MDRLITLSRAFQSHHITADEFRQLFIEAVGTMTADDWLSLTYLFADAELDDVFDEHELTNTRPGGDSR